MSLFFKKFVHLIKITVNSIPKSVGITGKVRKTNIAITKNTGSCIVITPYTAKGIAKVISCITYSDINITLNFEKIICIGLTGSGNRNSISFEKYRKDISVRKYPAAEPQDA